MRPEPGYRLDHAIATTYSLDLLAMLAAPLAFSAFAEADAADVDPLVLLESLRASAERITLFCDAGRIYVPPANRPLLAHLEGSVVECVAPLGGAFHPKIWLLRFVGQDDVRFRFLCLSRNLTFDRSWDTALVLDGRPGRRTRSANRPLAEFVGALPGMSPRPPRGARAEAIERIAADVLKVEWELPEPFAELAFRPLGHRGRRSPWPFGEARVDRMLVVAPFVSTSMLEDLSARGSGHVIVSRADRLDLCAPDSLSGYERSYVLDDGASDDGEDSASAAMMRGLHAKFFVADQGREATVWTGSANATASAFERNVEFMVEMRGRKVDVGVGSVLKAGERSEVSFVDLLSPYQRGEGPDSEVEDERALEREADRLRRELTQGGMRLRAIPGAAEDVWDLAVESTRPHEKAPSLRSLEVWPITRARQAAARPVDLALVGEVARFGSLPAELLTPFLACRIVLAREETTLDQEFVLALDLLDEPPGRRARILRSLLSNRGDVLRYLLYLLSGDPTEALRTLTRAGGEVDGSRTGVGTPALPLMESLLRTLDRDPERLSAVSRIVAELEASEGGESLLPDGWETIWEPVRALVDRSGK
ncbi:MAG: phospholipase D-like domain-containing protein [Dehalococcoidia bacterium]